MGKLYKHSRALWVQIEDMPKWIVHSHNYSTEEYMRDLRKMYEELNK